MQRFQQINGQVKHVHTLRVRYVDTDRMDMVYHGTYAAYLEAARVEMLRDAGWVYADLEKAGTLLPVVQLNLIYKKPARYDALLEVHTHITAPLSSKLQLRCEVRQGETLLVVGEVVLVFVDSVTGRPCRPPDGMSPRLDELGLIAAPQ